MLTLKSDRKRKRIACIIILTFIVLCVSRDSNQSTKGANLASFVGYSFHRISDQGISISYMLNGGMLPDFDGSVNTISDASGLSKIPYRNHYRFDGWYLDQHYIRPFSEEASIYSENIVVYAKWVREVDNYDSVMNYEYVTEKERDSKILLLKNLDFYFLDQLEIPGFTIQNNNIWDSIFKSSTQNPQGLCITDEFFMTTSYSDEDDCMGELLVFDKQTGELLVALGLDPNSHLGGIAFDGKNVWLCNSYEGTIERISYDFIQLMAYANKGDYVDATSVVDCYDVDNKPSCITFYDGRIWIATHTKFLDSQMCAYHYDSEHNSLKYLSSYRIPSQVQGVSFAPDGKVYLSTSYGRDISSYIKIYDSLIDMDIRVNKPLLQIEMPPASEEIDIERNLAYVIFESANQDFLTGADGYGTCNAPIDKILVIDLTHIFE